MMNRKHYLHILGTAVFATLCSIANNFSGGVGAAEALSASDAPEFELAGITVEAKRPDWESKLSPGTVTVIRPEEYKGEQKDLPDLLKMVPGVHVREVNGKGQYTVVTVRGSTAAQVGVFVDGVMTNLGGDAAVDISTIPVKNVERIEVYRGYIPARFGGTFIGGVINVVTKKPTKANISAELGKASFGGKSASLEVVSPLASGSLLVGLNYEAAKGDFPYHNYSMDSDIARASYRQSYEDALRGVEAYTKMTDSNTFHKTNIDSLYNNGEGSISKDVYDRFVNSSGQVDSDDWLDFVRSGGLIQAEIEYAKEKARVTSGISQEWNTTIETYVNTKDFLEKAGNWYIAANKKDSSFSNSKFIKHYKTYMRKIEDAKRDSGDDPDAFKKKEQELLGKYGGTLKSDILGLVKLSWNNRDDPNDYFRNDPTAKKQIDDIIYEEVDKKAAAEIERIKNAEATQKDKLDTNGTVYRDLKYKLSEEELRVKNAEALEKAKAERHRKYNDRKNISSLIKWQNDNWMVKASYNHINRHLPDSLWGMEQVASEGWNVGAGTDVYDHFFADSRKQTMDTYDLMLQNRQQHGRLEWGWFVDYQHQKKKYNAEHKLYYPWDENGKDIPELSASSEADTWRNSVLRGWSQYNSNKYNLQMDGSYKLSERQILEFQANYSYEKMSIDGHNMQRALNTKELWEWLAPTWRVRNRYEQKILNIQLQDTITLDKKASWFLTPSWRFNSSTIVGYSDSKNFRDIPDNSANAIKWFHPRDSQRDRKGTWQLALKKNVNDNLTFRMTGGTYYRLLNMYEIAGDGAGILPMPHKGWDTAAFPQPEYGKQFDFSTLWNGKFGKSDAYVTLTYFWRDTQRMLQLRRMAKDFFCYTNDSKGKVHGFELQSGLKWDHFSVDLEATYTNTHAMAKTDKNIPGGDDVWYESRATYQPEWEGNVRLSWFPSPKFTLFSEAHYIGKFYTYTLDGIASKSKFDLGCPTPSTTVVNAGIKLQPNKAWQFTLGCNDIFNQNPKQKILIGDDMYINPACPLQGRTYYATIHYEF